MPRSPDDGKKFKCPKCGAPFGSPIPVSEAWCSGWDGRKKTHPLTRMVLDEQEAA